MVARYFRAAPASDFESRPPHSPLNLRTGRDSSACGDREGSTGLDIPAQTLGEGLLVPSRETALSAELGSKTVGSPVVQRLSSSWRAPGLGGPWGGNAFSIAPGVSTKLKSSEHQKEILHSLQRLRTLLIKHRYRGHVSGKAVSLLKGALKIAGSVINACFFFSPPFWHRNPTPTSPFRAVSLLSAVTRGRGTDPSPVGLACAAVSTQRRPHHWFL